MCQSPKVNDPYDALVYFKGPTTYIHDSYHKTTALTIENDSYIALVYFRVPLPYIPGSYHKTATFVIENKIP